jgi:hypothetical protein
MTELVNFKWPQGEDLNIQLMYKEGEDERTAKPVSLAAGYALRMDIVAANGTLLHSYTSEASDDYPAGNPSALGSGLNDQPNINIYLSRGLTLTGGALNSLPTCQYDLFLRNTATNKQYKLIRGSITFEKSHTQWA